ncbi:hypothetical protein KKJFFJLC_00060 [Vibrio phage vB_VpaS_PGB]|nr:hypothetical protein HHKILHMN_00037 [Vibrio phage vB_VpaS_PGA]WVH05603.1 hypothetical protein KKJFFJLC_00060 [Vibrio phage vB_VpaS_PGB]
MKTINSVAPIAVQTIQVPIGDYDYTIRMVFCDTFMSYDLSIDDALIVEGFRMVFGQPLIPYEYQEVDGNFILDTDGSEPDYNEFGSTQFLRWLSPEETADFREAWKNGEY